MSIVINILDVIAWIFAIMCEIVGLAVAVVFFITLFSVIMALTDR